MLGAIAVNLMGELQALQWPLVLVVEHTTPLCRAGSKPPLSVTDTCQYPTVVDLACSHHFLEVWSILLTFRKLFDRLMEKKTATARGHPGPCD